MKNEYSFIDPKEITESQLPIIILEEDRQGMFGWAIRWHCKDNYNHAEIMVHPGKVASQNPGGYKEWPIDKVMTSRAFLKFWQFDPVDHSEIDIIREAVEKDLAKPWWKRRYDFLGILGQAVGLRWIQSPWGKFCSESVAANLRLIPRLQAVIPPRPSPAELNQIFKTMPEMKMIGYWWKD
jgi:hypothetical protein